ncbi:MAG: hypothetical protein P4N59_18145 [Negativicutes bacterium]|nr:hypothetical protein [Negativicutes bacterium]
MTLGEIPAVSGAVSLPGGASVAASLVNLRQTLADAGRWGGGRCAACQLACQGACQNACQYCYGGQVSGYGWTAGE